MLIIYSSKTVFYAFAMNEKIGFWFHWDEDTTYCTLMELNQLDAQVTGGLTNYLWTLREILEKHWSEYQENGKIN